MRKAHESVQSVFSSLHHRILSASSTVKTRQAGIDVDKAAIASLKRVRMLRLVAEMKEGLALVGKLP